MKVILTEEVGKLGGAHEIVEVADGYARNFLLPRSMAVPATKSAMSNLDNTRRVAERRQVRMRGVAQESASQLNGKTIVVPARVGSGGRLYGSIGTQDIADQIKKTLGVELERKQIVLPEAIRNVGLYLVPLTLHRDVTAHVTVQVGDAPEGGFAPVDAPVVEAPVAEPVAATDAAV